MKRSFDLLAALTALVLLSPVLVVTAVLVRLKLGSPVLFRQVRPGLHGRPFTIYKFRTMTDERDEHGEWLPDEMRLTSFGLFMRRFSLDELPQLFNVLKGDLSLVGPRPLLMRYLELYTPEQARRNEVRPGITGWAQVNGRNAIAWEDKFALDVWYVDHRTFRLDLYILWLTVRRVVQRDGIAMDGHATMPEFKGGLVMKERQTCNLLFTSAGRRVALIRHFKQTLLRLGVPGKIVTADLRRTAPAHFVGDVQELVPRVTDPAYIEALKDICRRHEIRLLVPLIDTELTLLAKHRGEFAEMGVTVLVSSPEVNEICFDKRNTYRFFKQADVETPEILDAKLILADRDAAYPFLLKPADGSCSVGVTKIRNAWELQFFKEYVPNAIVQELVSGKEFTCDVLVDFDGEVRCVVPRLRIETRAGEVSKGMTVKNKAIIEAVKRVVDALPDKVGCITVQCFLTNAGRVSFIEINPRFGGGFPLAAEAGADYPKWIVQMLLGDRPEIELDGWADGVTMLRYDDAVFVGRGAVT